ncbi:MAG: UDP-N-acetylmuramate dehydrogenase [Bacillota bacterium]
MTKGEVLAQEPMARHTSFRIGGNADILVAPATLEDLEAVLDLAFRRGVPYLVFGGGTNLLVRDGGIRGMAVKIGKGLDGIRVLEDGLEAGAGLPLAQVARQAQDAGLGGLEFAFGIPGTLGGAISMNAGAHSGTISQVITEVKAVRPGGESRTLCPGDLEMGYRESVFSHTDWVCVTATLRLAPCPPEEIREASRRHLMERRRSQPLSQPSAGSVFKNPPGDSAGRLIEAAGLKGRCLGGAQISQVHANFIVNTGGATARDVLELVDEARQAVQRVHGIWLELEIRVEGEG